MIPIDRTTILDGPCLVTFNAATFYHDGAATIEPVKKTVALKNSRFGTFGKRLLDNYHTIKFTSDGQVTAPICAALYSFGSLFPGMSVFGPTDQQLTVQSIDGRLYTAYNAALTTPAGLDFTVDKPVFGEVTFTAIRKKGSNFSDANSIYTLVSNPYPGDGAFQEQNILMGQWTGCWANVVPTGTITGDSDANPDVVTTSAAHGLVAGDTVIMSGVGGDTAINGAFTVATTPTTTTFTVYQLGTTTPVAGAGSYTSGGTFTRSNPFDLFDTEDGFKVSFNWSTTPKSSNNAGLYDMKVTDLQVTVTAKPVGPFTENDLLNAMNMNGLARGADLTSLAQTLKLAMAGLYFWLYQADIDKAALKYDSLTNRIDEITWTASRSIRTSTGTLTGATNATPIVVTTAAAHGLQVNDQVTISGVVGNTAANGTFFVKAVADATHFSLKTLGGADVAGNGAYTSGGTFSAGNANPMFKLSTNPITY